MPRFKLLAAALTLAALVLAFDLYVPLGVAAGVPYVALVLTGMWAPRDRYLYGFAALGTVLTALGYFFSDPMGVSWIVLTNRGVAITVIWVTALLILAQRGKERERLEERQNLQGIMDNVMEGIVVIDERGVIEAFNPAAEELFGYKASEVAGSNISVLMPQPYRKLHDGYLSNFRESGVAKVLGSPREMVGQTKDGTTFDMEIRANEMRLGGRRKFIGSVRDITNRKKMEDELRRREARFRALIENAQDIITVLDAGGIAQFVSPSIKRVLGYAPSEQIGERVFDFVHPEDLSKVAEDFQEVITNQGSVATTEFRYKHKNGTWRVMESVGMAKLDPSETIEVIINSRDVTDRKLAEDDVRHNQETLRLFMDSVADNIAIFDANLNYIDVNRAQTEQIGIPREEFIGRNMEDLVPETKTSGRFDEYLNVVRTGEPLHIDFAQTKFVTGLETHVSLRAFKVGDGLGLVVEDITERMESLEALRAAKEEAELANMTKSQFLANMSHELRTPLNAINGFAQAMLSGIGGKPTGKHREYLRDISASGDHLLALIEDVLDLSKVELGEIELNDETVDLTDCVETCVGMFNERKQEARLEVQTDGLVGLPPIRGDRRKIKQVLLNLLSNAFKFTDSRDKVMVGAGLSNDGSAYIQVADTGIGMSPAEIEIALAPFGQVESGMSRNYEGSGLGLPLCKSLVEAHGGALEIESERGVGTKVTVTFPQDRTMTGIIRVGAASQA